MHLSRAKAEPDYTAGTGSTAVNPAAIPSHGHHGAAEKAENKQKVVVSAEEKRESGEGDSVGDWRGEELSLQGVQGRPLICLGATQDAVPTHRLGRPGTTP